MTLYTVCDLYMCAVWCTVSLVHILHGTSSYCACMVKKHFYDVMLHCPCCYVHGQHLDAFMSSSMTLDYNHWLCVAAGPPIIHWGTPLTSLGGQQGVSFAKSSSTIPLLLYEQVGL